jgi:hypothetical protein
VRAITVINVCCAVNLLLHSLARQSQMADQLGHDIVCAIQHHPGHGRPDARQIAIKVGLWVDGIIADLVCLWSCVKLKQEE